MIPQATTVAIQEAIYMQDIEALKTYLNKLPLQSVSYYDTMGENFYHGLILGLCAMLDNHYHVSSNREAENGRYDIALFPKQKNLPGIIIELKVQKNCSLEALEELAKDALDHINVRKYDEQMKGKNILKILNLI